MADATPTPPPGATTSTPRGEELTDVTEIRTELDAGVARFARFHGPHIKALIEAGELQWLDWLDRFRFELREAIGPIDRSGLRR